LNLHLRENLESLKYNGNGDGITFCTAVRTVDMYDYLTTTEAV